MVNKRVKLSNPVTGNGLLPLTSLDTIAENASNTSVFIAESGHIKPDYLPQASITSGGIVQLQNDLTAADEATAATPKGVTQYVSSSLAAAALGGTVSADALTGMLDAAVSSGTSDFTTSSTASSIASAVTMSLTSSFINTDEASALVTSATSSFITAASAGALVTSAAADFVTSAEASSIAEAAVEGITVSTGGTMTNTYAEAYSYDRLRQYQHENYCSSGILAIIDDDGYHAFIDQGIAQVYRDKGVRCSIAMAACRAETTSGTTTSGDPYVAMSWAELASLAEEGFEILNHSYSHNRDVFPSNSGATEAQYITEYEEAQKLFLAHGFNPRTIVYPWGSPAALGKNVARRYFDYGVLYSGSNGTVNFSGLNYLSIPRSTSTLLSAIKEQIDACAANKTLMVWGMHSYMTGPTPSAAVLGEVIDYALSKGVRIEPFERAMRLRKPALDCGTADGTRITIYGDGTFNDRFVTTLINRAIALGLLNNTSSSTTITGVTVSGATLCENSGVYTAAVSPSSASQSVIWGTTDSDIATIDGGTVTVVGNGTVSVTAASTQDTSVSGSLLITARIPAGYVEITGSTVINGTGTLSYTVSPANAYDKDMNISWQSSNTDVATVDGGTITVLSEGTTQITLTLGAASLTDTIELTCHPDAIEVTGVTISGASTITDTGVLTASVSPDGASQEVSWTSSDDRVATVTGGTVVVLTAGTVTITATSTQDTSKSATKDITCEQTPATVILGTAPVAILSSGVLTAETDPAGCPVVWHSSDDRVSVTGGTVNVLSDVQEGESSDVTLVAQVGGSTAAVTLPCLHEAHMCDLTNRVGYVYAQHSDTLSVILYTEFIVEKKAGTATSVFSGQGASAALTIIRPNSLNNVIRVYCGKDSYYDSTESTAEGDVTPHTWFSYRNSHVDGTLHNGYMLDGVDVSSNTALQEQRYSQYIAFNYEKPLELTGYMTNEQLFEALQAGTISTKSGTATVKLKRLILFKSAADCDIRTVDAVFANLDKAIIDIVGTPDNKLINMRSAVDQPILSLQPVEVTGVTISGPDEVDAVGTFTASVSPANAYQGVLWESSDTDVATVTGGTVAVVSAGTVSITATYIYDATKSASKSIVCKLESATVLMDAATSAIVGSGVITATTIPAGLPITWSASDPRVSISGGTVTVNTDAEGSANCDVTFTAAIEGSTSSVTLPCITAPQMCDLTNRVGYVPLDDTSNTFDYSTYTEFVLEKGSSTFSLLYEDKAEGTESVLQIMRPNSLSRRLKCTFARVGYSDVNETTAAGDVSEQTVFSKGSVTSAECTATLNGQPYAQVETNRDVRAANKAGYLGFNFENVRSLLTYTTPQALADALSAGTIATKSGTLTVKLRRLIITHTIYATADELKANSASALLDLVGTADGRLVNMASNGIQPILSTPVA